MNIKKILIVLVVIASTALYGCDEILSEEKISVAPASVEFDASGGSKQLTVKSNSSWKVTSSDSWLTLSKLSGEGGDVKITLTAGANTNTTVTRAASVTFTSVLDSRSVTIEVFQGKANTNITYMPVIFHVFYNNASDEKQNISAAKISNLLAVTNKYMSGEGMDGEDILVRLSLVTTTPDGKTLAEPGIERIYRGNILISGDKFLSDPNEVSTLWDPNKYVNIYVFDISEEFVSGVSVVAFTSSASNLAGLVVADGYFSNKPKYPHSVVLSNRYIESDPSTLAHEFGHYLGLYHCFTEKGCGSSDYCDDTPNYDRELYSIKIANMDERNPEAFYRAECVTGLKFKSYNIMDYYYLSGYRYTKDQKARVQNAITYSPFVPSSKPKIRGYSAGGDTPAPIIMR